MKFAIALLVEKDRHRINWCAFEEEFCHRHKKAYEPMSKYHLRLKQEGKSWPINEVGSDTASKTKGEGIYWKVNVGRKDHGSGLIEPKEVWIWYGPATFNVPIFERGQTRQRIGDLEDSVAEWEFPWSYSLTLAALYPWYVLVYDT